MWKILRILCLSLWPDYSEVIWLQLLWLTTTLFSFIYLIENACSKYIGSFHFYGVTVMYTLMAIWKSRHWHLGISIVIRISTGIGMKKMQCLHVFSCAELWHQCHFTTNIYFSMISSIHSSKRVHLRSRKKLFEFSEASVHWCFDKVTAPKISGYFPAKHLEWSPFQVNSQAFPKSCLEQLFCRELVSTCFCKKELHNTCYLRNFPGF